MAAGVESAKASHQRKRWLAFLDCSSATEAGVSATPPSTAPRALNDVNTEIVQSFRRASGGRPSSASGTEYPRPSLGDTTRRPSTAHASLKSTRGGRAPSSGGRWTQGPRLSPLCCPRCGSGRPFPKGLLPRGGRGGAPLRPPLRLGGVGRTPGGTAQPRPEMRGAPVRGGRWPRGPMPPRGRMPPRGPLPPRGPMPPRGAPPRRGPMPPRTGRGRGPRGPMDGRGRERGRFGGRIMVGPRGVGMGRGRGRPPPRPGMQIESTPRRAAGSADVVIADAPPSWMSSALKAGSDDDDDFAQPVPVSKSTTFAKDESPLPPPERSAPAPTTRMPPWAIAYKSESASQEPSQGESGATAGQGAPSGGSGESKGGGETNPPPPGQMAEASSAPHMDGVPDWLQSTAPKPTVPTEKGLIGSPAEVPEAGGLHWLQSLALPNTAAAAAGAAVPSPTQGGIAGETASRHNLGGSAGNVEVEEEEVDWLGAALKGKSPAVGSSKPAAEKAGTADVQNGGDDWLAVAQSSSHKGRSKSRSTVDPPAASSAASGWMSSGKLGLPAGDDSEEDVVGKIGVSDRMDRGSSSGRTTSKKKNKKKTGQISPTASGPDGWLSAGALGIPTEERSDDDSSDSSRGGDVSGRVKGQAVTIETQTEEDIATITKEGVTEKVNSPKLPPWAKPWVPPPEPETAPDSAPDTSSAPDQGTKNETSDMPDWLAAAVGATPGQAAAEVTDQEKSHVTTAQGSKGGDDGGLDWLTKAAQDSSTRTSALPTTSLVAGTVDSAVDGAEGDGGLDWLTVAKSSGQKKSKAQAPAVKGVAAVAVPGGWISSGKLGISTEDEDDDSVGVVNGGGVSAAAVTAPAGKPKKRKQPRESVSAASGSGGWLTSGALGVEPEVESDDDDGAGDAALPARGAGVTIETQTEDDIEAVTEKGVAEKSAASKLPPWAKPYVPPPEVEKVPDTAPEDEEAKGTDKQEPGVPDWLAAAAGAPSKKESTTSAEREGVTAGKGDGDGDGGGLSWLTSVAEQSGSGASAPAAASSDVSAGGGGPDDWLAVAKSSGQTKRKQNMTAIVAKGSTAPAAPGGWMSSGNLGIPTSNRSDSDDDVVGKSTVAAAKKGKKQKQVRRSVSAASGPEGWLTSGALGAPAEDESDDDEEGGDGRSKAVFVTTETQTDNDIEAIVARGDVSKLPPWAKPYIPPPKPEDVPDVAAEAAVEEEGPIETAPATPDWILASVGATGSEDHGGVGGGVSNPGDWLAQAAQPGSNGRPAAAADSEGPDWLRQAAVADTKPSLTTSQRRPGGVSRGGRKAATAQSPLTWMSTMKRRSSMDLDDPSVESAIASAKAKTIPGGWLQIGALGAPDAVEEENALEAARAASSLPSEPTSDGARRRSSLSGGAPPWAPEKEKGTAHKSGGDTTASRPTRRPSLGGGMPRWAPAPAAVTDEKTAASGDEGGGHKDDTQSAAKEVGEPETPGVRVNDWLAAAAGAAVEEKTTNAADGDSGPVIEENGGDDGGLDWLTQAASEKTTSVTSKAVPSNTGMNTGETDVGVDWLAAATSSKSNKKTAAVERASTKPTVASGWMSSGKLGLSAGDDSDEDRAGTTKSTQDKETKGFVPAAGVPGGWLSSGALGVPGEDEGGVDVDNYGKAERTVLVSTGTQTEDDIESAVKANTGPKLPPWAKPWVPPPQEPTPVPDDAPAEPSSPLKEEIAEPAAPDWILASLGTNAHDTSASVKPVDSGGADDWLAQAAQPGAPSAGESSQNDVPDWVHQANIAETKPNATRQRPSGNRRKKVATAQSPLSWMSSMKRRSSMDLNDDAVEAAIVSAKAKTVPGGWLQVGALGAPDAVAAENALEEARAASSLSSNDPSTVTTDRRRPSLEGGLPPWAPTSSSSTHGRRPSLDGGLPPWASQQQSGTAQANENLPAASSSKRLSAQEEDDAPVERRPGLAGGMPAWAPAEKTTTSGSVESNRRKRRSSLDRGMPSWAPPPASTVASESSPKPHLGSRGAEGPSLTGGTKVEPSVPDWLAAAAGGPAALQDGRPPHGDALVDDGKETRESGQTSDGLSWLTQAASPGQPPDSRSRTVLQAASRVDDTVETTQPSSVAGGAGLAGETSGGGGGLDWLSAAATVPKRRNLSDQQPRTAIKNNPGASEARNVVASVPKNQKQSSAAGRGWLTAAIASGKLGLPSEGDPGRDSLSAASPAATVSTSALPGGWLTSSIGAVNVGDEDDVHRGVDNSADHQAVCSKRDTATQTNDVLITEMTSTVFEKPTSSKEHQSNLPPWAKPWKPQAPATADPDPPSPSGAADNQQETLLMEGNPEASGVSSGRHGALDWIHATLNGPSSSIAATEDVADRDGDRGAKYLGNEVTATNRSADGSNGGAGLDWLSSIAGATGAHRETSDSAGGGLGTSVGGDGTDEANQPGQAATTKTSSGKEGDESAGGGSLGWLASARLGGQTGRNYCEGPNAAAKKNTKRTRLAKSAVQEESSQVVPQNGPGGWMAAAVLSGRFGGDIDAASDDSLRPLSKPASGGVTIETQTDDNIGQAIAEQARPKLPPWAKPWSLPPQVAAADPAPAAPSPREGRRGIKPDGEESSAPNFRGGESFVSDTGDGGGSGGGSNVLDWITQLTGEKPGPTGEPDKIVDASGPVDVLAAALSGNSQRVADAATAICTTSSSRDGGASNHRTPADGSSRKNGAARQPGATKQRTPAGKPGGWLATAGMPVASSLVDEMDGAEERESDDDRGACGKRAGVETVTVGVQWEEGVGDSVKAPMSSSSGRLPPWAKPYAPPMPSIKPVEEERSEDSLRMVEVSSSGIQCGESVLGG